MKIVMNGEQQEVDNGATLFQLLERHRLAAKRLAIEINEEIVPRTEYAFYRLNEGDRVEVIQAIGGG